MSNSFIVDWLNENQFRAYPLKNEGTRVFASGALTLDPIILDANLILSGGISTIAPKLTAITISGGNCNIVTTYDTFTISNYLNASYPQYIRKSTGSLLVVGEAIKSVVSNATFTDVYFEASTFSLFDSYWFGVFSINMEGVSLPNVWEAGYQFKITADEDTNILTLGAHRNYGIPIGCEEYFPSIQKDCAGIISYINGVESSANNSNFQITVGDHLTIYNDTDNHRIYIGLSFEEQDICKPINNRPLPNIT